ncbi:MAG: porin [Alphaproteobacteria bacterium]
MKAIYFTPRFSGFQLAASLTPRNGNNGRGATGEGTDNLYELGASYAGKFGDVGVNIAGTYQDSSDISVGNGTAASHANNVWSVGARLTFGGFTVAAGYEDLNDSGLTAANTAAGQNAGTIYNVGVGYKTGPWGVSAGYQYGERDISTTDEADVASISLAGQYAVAPGWTAMLEYVRYDVDNGDNTAANDRSGVMITNQFVF